MWADWDRSSLLAFGVLVSSAVACTGSSSSVEARPVAALRARLQTARQRSSASLVGRAGVPWVEAVRDERWADAARLIDSLPAGERSDPAMRLVRARVASELGDDRTAARLLHDLERELPAVSDLIARYRAEAELAAGPFDSAAAYYSRGTSAESWVKAGIAFERGGELDKARKAVDRALSLLAKATAKKRRSANHQALEAEARALRARVAEKQGDAKLALSDLRWLATSVPTNAHAAHADEGIRRLSPSGGLTRKERFDRAVNMAREGLVEATERELELLQNALGPPIKEAAILRTRGFARFVARREYKMASELLSRAAELGSEQSAKDLFYAARALSREHEDQRAIELYQALALRFPASSWAEDARFLSARLLYIDGRWSEAAAAYTRYLIRHARGRYSENAKYERAVAWLAEGQAAKAASVFSELAKRETEPRARSRLFALEGTAWARAGVTERATLRFQQAIREQPLSFAALSSAARLRVLEQPVPPLIDPPAPATPAPALEPRLSERVEVLIALGLDADAERALAAEERIVLRTHGDRGHEALCTAYGRLNVASERYRAGIRAARPDALNVAPNAGTRWLWDCIYPRPYRSLVNDVSVKEALQPELLYAIMRQESGFRPAVVSPAGAVGLMQLLETTAERLTQELEVEFAPKRLVSAPYNVNLAARYLRKLLDMFGGNVALAAAAYNAGPRAVSRWLETGEELPLDVFVARIPYDETRGYVDRVVGNLARYAYLSGGEAAVPRMDLHIPQGLRAPADAY
jgi:soluble lytic murein transglycosylase